MGTALKKSILRIINEFSQLNHHTKTILRVGRAIFIILFITGAAVAMMNRLHFNLDAYFEFIAQSIIKSSFTVLAEIVIGALIIDFAFNKEKKA